MISKRIFILAFVLSFFSHVLLAQSSSQLGGMLDYFKANCSVAGGVTESALADTDVLISTLKSIQDGPDCGGLMAVTSKIDYMSRLNKETFQALADSEKTVLALEAEKNQVLQLIDYTQTTDEKNQLTQKLNDLNVRIAGAISDRNFLSDDRNIRLRNEAAQNLSRDVNSLLNQLAGQQDCWVKHPQILQQIGSFGEAIGQNVALGFTTGGISSAIGAGTSLIAGILRYYSERRAARDIAQFQSSKVNLAIACAMEHFSDQWCSAQDGLKAIEMVNSKPNVSIQSFSWDALRLFQDEIPVLAKWLEQVKSGSEVSSSSSSQQRNLIEEKEQALRATKNTLVGLVNQKKDDFSAIDQSNSSPDKKEEEKFSIVREIVVSTISIIYPSGFGNGNPVQNPMSVIYTKNIGAFFLVGISEDKIPTNSSGDKKSFENVSLKSILDSNPNFRPSLEVIRDQFQIWFDEATKAFEREKQRTLFDDPLLIFVNSQESIRTGLIGAQRYISPIKAMNNIVQFLNQQSLNTQKPFIKTINRETLRALSEIQQAIDTVLNSSLESQALEDLASTQLSVIFKSARLENGLTFLQKRIETAVNVMITDMAFDTNVDDFVYRYIASGDVVSSLKLIANTNETTILRNQLLNTQSITQTNIAAFTDVFSDTIKNVLEDYDEQIKNFGESNNGPTRLAKSHLCLQLMSLPAWNSRLGIERCEGVWMTSAKCDV